MPSLLDKPARPLPVFSPDSLLLPALQPLTILPPNYRTGQPVRPVKPLRATRARLQQNLNKHGVKEVRAGGGRVGAGFQDRETKRVKLTTIRLYGVLGKRFGRVWRLDVANIGEAITAIDAQRPGFRKALVDLDQGFDFLVRVGKRVIGEKELPLYTNGRTICITPVAHGGGGGNTGWLQVIGGVILAIVGIVLIEFGGAALIVGGIGMIIGGIATLISGTPGTDPAAANKRRSSYQFGSAQNIAVQGAPCALAYGYPFCGSVVESSSIVNEDYRTGTVKPSKTTLNSNTVGGLFTEEKGDGTLVSFDGPANSVGGSQLDDGTISGGGGGGGGGGGTGGPVLANYAPERSERERREAMGAGGGGSEASSGAKEDPDTLSSRQYAAIKDIICEGPIQGLGNGQQSILFDRTPLQNPDNTFNFQDYEIHFVSGRQDQSIIPGFDSEEATQSEGGQLRHGFPFVRTYNDPNLDALRVAIRVPRLQKQNPKNGDLSGANVQLTIELNIDGQGWVQKINDNIVGKASNAYTRDYRIDIPANNRPGSYQIRITRITPDSTTQALSNDTYVETVTRVTYVKLRHPNTVKCGLKVNAQQFSNIPTRTYRVYGLLVKVPSNYDPVAHTYAGDWDGTFKTAWTCNPAWILFDLILNNRYGLGNYINFGSTDKWAFYRAGVYCDELVPRNDAAGGMERRYECHAYIAGRQDALQVVSDICNIFRAAAAYIGGQIIPVLDRYVSPSEYAGQFGPDNVINGDFTFANSSRKARHTVALVTWNDPERNGDAQVEYVENSSQVHRYGVRELNVTAIGCYSRGQAHRLGQWLLLTEQYRTEICTFKTELEGAILRPGDIIQISTPFRAGKTMSGRMAGATLNTITLDHPVTIEAGSSYQISIADLTGALVEVPVANAPGTYTTLNLTRNLAALPSEESTWILIASTLVPELFRVQTLNMVESNQVEVSAITYNPSLYDTVDKGTPLDTYPTSNLPSAVVCRPPTDLVLAERAVVEGTGVYRMLEATWTASPDEFFRNYGIRYRINKGNWVGLPNAITTTADIPIRVTGTYEFSVQAYNALGAPSSSITASYVVEDANPLPMFLVTGLQLYGKSNGSEFGGRDIQLTWRVNSVATAANDFGDERYGASTGGLDPSFQDFELRFYRISDGRLVFSQRTLETQYTFNYDVNCQVVAEGELVPKGPYRALRIELVGHDKYGGETLPISIVASNPVPAKINASTVVAVKKFSNVTFRVPDLVDIDLAGLKIYGSPALLDVYRADQPGFVPDKAFLVYDGSSVSASVIQTPGSKVYYRFGAFDVFNPAEFVLSEPLPVTNDYLTEADFTATLRGLIGIIEPTAAGLYQEITNRVTADSALSSRVDIVYAIAGNNSASISTITTAFADYRTAQATLTQTLQVQVDNNRAAVETEASTRATQFGALSTLTTTLGASFNGLQASVQTQAMAIAGLNGQLASSYSITLNTNGYISGLRFFNDGSTADVIFLADTFKIVSPGESPVVPFSVSAGAVVLGVTLRSANFVKGVSGYRVQPNGKGEFNRLVIRNPVITYQMAAPIVAPGSTTFTGSITVTISHDYALANGGSIYYTTDGSEPTINSALYTPGATLTFSAALTMLKAMANIPDTDDNPTTKQQTSSTVTAIFVKLS